MYCIDHSYDDGHAPSEQKGMPTERPKMLHAPEDGAGSTTGQRGLADGVPHLLLAEVSHFSFCGHMLPRAQSMLMWRGREQPPLRHATEALSDNCATRHARDQRRTEPAHERCPNHACSCRTVSPCVAAAAMMRVDQPVQQHTGGWCECCPDECCLRRLHHLSPARSNMGAGCQQLRAAVLLLLQMQLPDAVPVAGSSNQEGLQAASSAYRRNTNSKANWSTPMFWHKVLHQ
jgi:hypothetical protein